MQNLKMIRNRSRVGVGYIQLKQEWSRGDHGSEALESTPVGFCVFLSDPKSKFCEKPDPDPKSLFNFSSSRNLCGHL